VGKSLNKIINNFKGMFRKTKTVERIIPPNVTLSLRCNKHNGVLYVGFELKDPTSSNTSSIVCPVCKQSYSVRIKASDIPGRLIRVGPRHSIIIKSINRTETKRAF
jgi:hypothetical protein